MENIFIHIQFNHSICRYIYNAINTLPIKYIQHKKHEHTADNSDVIVMRLSLINDYVQLKVSDYIIYI